MTRLVSEEIYKSGKVVWRTIADPEPDYYLIYRQNRFYLYATISGAFQGYETGFSRVIGKAEGYEEAYLCDLYPCSWDKLASSGCYLAFRDNDRWKVYAISIGRDVKIIENESSLQSLQEKLFERVQIDLGWTNLLLRV